VCHMTNSGSLSDGDYCSGVSLSVLSIGACLVSAMASTCYSFSTMLLGTNNDVYIEM
jgi:hypothetical protein